MKYYAKSPKKEVLEADPIDVIAEDPKQAYLKKLRDMGILKKESEMPKRKAVGQIEESIKKSGRNGFEPVSSKKTRNLYRERNREGSVEHTLEKAFSGEKFSPEDQIKKEDEFLENIQKSDMPEKRKKEYIDVLKTRMRTA